MTCATTVTVVVRKALHFEGKPRTPGERMHLAPVNAGHLLMSGRAALADDADRATVNEALQRADADFIARGRTSDCGRLNGGAAARS